MDSRPVLSGKGTLSLFIDSISINNLLSSANPTVEKLLSYHKSDLFEFVRSPHDTSHAKLKNIPKANTKTQEGSTVIEIEEKSSIRFGYNLDDVWEIGKSVFNKEALNEEDKGKIIMVFINSILNREKPCLLITHDDLLLKHRLWFEAHAPTKTNIVLVDEVLEIMDLFAKLRNKYHMASYYTTNKGGWYWYSFRSKIPYYNVSSDVLKAFASRFIYLLTCLDEIGIQYYSDVNNDSIDGTLYHFNYFISLVTGIFDSLAIETKNKLNLKFKGDDIPSKISLQNKTGGDFLQAVRDTCPDLRKHINDYVYFIKLVYKFRELVIHREGFSDTTFHYRDQDACWKAIFVKIDAETIDLIKQCCDKKKLYDPISEWGVFHDDALGLFLSPYNFAKQVTYTLIQFANTYLRILGYPNFIKGLKSDDEFLKTIDTFENNKLGF